MFERDDLFTALRLRDLRAAADQARMTHIDASGLIDRARRTVGNGLVELGSAIAGVRSAAPASRHPCDDHEFGATA